MVIPQVFPMFKREVSNDMYKPLPFYIARVLMSIVTYMLYPFAVTMTVVWFLGLPQLGIVSFLSFWGILLLLALIGSAMGLTVGAVIPSPISALVINQSVILIFSFGAGLYANTGTSANILVKLISWLSPLHYGCELLLRLLLKG